MRYSSLQCCILCDSKSFRWRWAPSRRTTWEKKKKKKRFWKPGSEAGVAALTAPNISQDPCFHCPQLWAQVLEVLVPQRGTILPGDTVSDHYNKSAAVQTLFCFQTPREKKRIICADQLTLTTSLRQGCFYTMKAERNMYEQFLILLATVTLN